MDYSMHYSTASVGEYSINILFNVVYYHFAIELLLVSTLFFLMLFIIANVLTFVENPREIARILTFYSSYSPVFIYIHSFHE